METSLSTMSSIELCTQMDHSSLLQFASSESCSPATTSAATAITSSPPLMHTLQPLPSDPADALVDYIDNLPKDEISALMPSAVEDFHGMPGVKPSSDQPGPATSAEQYSVCSTVDVKSFHEVVPASVSSSSQQRSCVPSYQQQPVSSGATVTADSAQFFYNSADPSALIEQSSSSSSVCSVPTSTVNPPVTTNTDSASQAPVRLDLPSPPKKPLSPYMRFSKGIWQQVKGINPGLTVCEVGATIGRMWRELSDHHKQQFNEAFVNDKAKYDSELQSYLTANGLQASQLPKQPRSRRRNDNKDRSMAAPSSNVTTSEPSNSTIMTPEMMAEEMARTILESAGMTGGDVSSALASYGASGNTSTAKSTATDPNTLLPSFSQVWSGQELYTSIDPSSVVSNANIAALPGQVSNTNLPPAAMTVQNSNAVIQQPSIAATPQQFTLSQFDLASSSAASMGLQQQHHPQHHAADGTTWVWSHHPDQVVDAHKIYQLNADGTTTLQQASAADFMPEMLEPGEIRMQAAAPNITVVNGLTTVTGGQQVPPSSELMLLREALSAKGKEAARLTRELELAYNLIQRLQQQNIMYQQLDWSAAIQQQQQHLQQPQQAISSNESNVEMLINGMTS